MKNIKEMKNKGVTDCEEKVTNIRYSKTWITLMGQGIAKDG